MRTTNVKKIGPAALLLSLAACGGASGAPGPQVAALPGATAPSGAGPGGSTGGADSVRDTGAGIAPAELPRIFDRFWRADESRSRVTGGSGLGPAIVRQLTEADGGTIEVESEPGRGTVFTIRLPAA